MPTSTVTSTATSALNQSLQNFNEGAQRAGQNLLTVYFSHLTLLEFFSVLISAALIGAIIYIAIETGWLPTRIDRFRDVVLKTDLPRQRAQAAWQRIEEHFYRGSENDLKISILEADKLLNDALRGAGLLGSQLGDRLKKVKPGQVPNLDDVWQAHKLRNQIAHEPNFKLKRDLAERALNIYEVALRNLGVFEAEEPTTASR